MKEKVNKIKQAHSGHKLAYTLIVALLLMMAVLLPFAVNSVLDDVFHQTNQTYYLQEEVKSVPANNTVVHMDFISLNEWEGTVTMRVTGHVSCSSNCADKRRLIFFSVLDGKNRPESLPSAAAIEFDPNELESSETITLPLVGDPIRYPYDAYTLGIGIAMEDIMPNGEIRKITQKDILNTFFLSVQSRIPRTEMQTPQELSESQVTVQKGYEYIVLGQTEFIRPLYLKVLTILLVLLVSAAAAYAVFMRPLDQLVISSGALVLGVWGVRAILLGANLPGFTSVDLALSVVILFLLGAMTLRALHYIDRESGIGFLTRRKKK